MNINKYSIFFTIINLFIFNNYIYSQCELTATAIPTDIVCGECVTLTAFGEGQGQSVFTESFDNGTPTGWSSTSQATYTNPCSPGGVDGTTHLWMGSQTGVPREMVTIGFDLTGATAGATLCFDMLFAPQTGDPDDAPCEGPDEPDEGVFIEYSIDGGNTWITIHYFDPNGGNDPALINWNNWCFPIPAAAITSNTMIRWFQDNDSGADYDHWGIDNVNLYFNDPTYEITWNHDGYSYGVGNAGGDNPNQVCPQSTTTYTVTMSNGTETCTDMVTINVVPPTFRADAGDDITICQGECTTLDAEATVVVRPAGIKTFQNNDFVPVLTGQAAVNINVQGLNVNNVTPGLISEICINGFNFGGNEFCTDFINGCDCNGTPINFGETCELDVSSFNVILTTPDGCSITLVPSGIATQAYDDVCFIPAGGQDINNGNFPTAGNWDSNEPISNLDGCMTSGVWTLQFDGGSGVSFGIGVLDGWSITFDDPEISYTGNYTWAPTANMTNETTLSPTVCPASTTTYIITVTDNASCATATDEVTVTVDPTCGCTAPSISTTTPAPVCAPNTVDISTFVNSTGSISYHSSLSDAQNNINPISSVVSVSGTYYIRSEDITDPSCVSFESIDIIIIDIINANVTIVQPTCNSNNGSITINASNGSTPYSYSIDNGLTFQTSNLFDNLTANDYNVIVQDDNGCMSTNQVITLSPSSAPTINNININHTNCGNNDGNIEVMASGGTPPLTYSIDNGTTFQSNNTFNNLNAGTYSIIVEDASGCQSNSQEEMINSSSIPIIDNVVADISDCNGNNGFIIISASSGIPPYSYSIDNGMNYQADNSFNNLPTGTYDIIVQDDNGCLSTIQQEVLTFNSASVNITGNNFICETDNSILDAGNGFTTYEWSWNTANTQTITVNTQGTYTVTVTNSNGCTATDEFELEVDESPEFQVTNSQTICPGESVMIGVVEAVGTNYSWSSSPNDASLTEPNSGVPSVSPLETTTYTITATSGICTETASVTIIVEEPSLNVSPDPTICPNYWTTLSAEGNPTGGTYEWLNENGAMVGNTASIETNPNQNTNFEVVYTSPEGCTISEVININVLATPNLSLSASPNGSIVAGTNVDLQVSGAPAGSTFDWIANTAESISGNEIVVASPNQTTLYTVTITTPEGCVYILEINIEVIQGIFEVPNIFTPNNDNLNDHFYVATNDPSVEIVEFKVFDRWGELIYDNVSTPGWDGTYKNKPMPSDIYVYMIRAIVNGQEVMKKGDIALMR